MEQRNFIVFINPISGTRNKKDLRSTIEKRLTALNFNYQILPTEKEGNYFFLKQKIETENITDVIICGGDGSVNQVTSQLLNTKINVGIVPMGSGNGLAFTAGISKNPTKALDIILKGNAAYVDAFMVNENYSCHLCGLGFDAQVSHDFAKQTKRGVSTYVKQTIKNFFKAKPYTFQITANGTTFTTQAFFISIANSNQFGNSILIAPKASLSDGLLDIVIVKKTGKFGLLFKLIRQINAGRLVDANRTDKPIHYFQTKKISILNIDNAPFHIDGEPMKTSATFNIQVIENAFLLLQP